MRSLATLVLFAGAPLACAGLVSCGDETSSSRNGSAGAAAGANAGGDGITAGGNTHAGSPGAGTASGGASGSASGGTSSQVGGANAGGANTGGAGGANASGAGGANVGGANAGGAGGAGGAQNENPSSCSDCPPASNYCQRTIGGPPGAMPHYSCQPLPAACGASPSCACLASVSCGAQCMGTKDSGFTVTCLAP
jgi:hypothetical protein